ncbi:MAG TPA: hypothetical protein VGB37_16520 [Candidatus Lokiarchaeia archaeon]
MIVTDFKWVSKAGEERKGYYMDGYEVENYLGIKRYLKKAWDVVGIISGHGKVRIGKSTKASQIGYLIAWLLAGGKIEIENRKVIRCVPPKKEVHFNLQENVVFSPRDLVSAAEKLYTKYGSNQIIIYDEARGGLASDRAMESINKTMSEWFEQCGQYGHIILLVLPNFFKLHEDYAVARSLFLVDVYADKNHNRGYFNFYNEFQKEKLYYFGKKRIGVTAKYSAAYENFWGRFNNFMPWDTAEYHRLKKEALSKLKETAYQKKVIRQRNAALYLLKRYSGLTHEAIAQELSIILGFPFSIDMIEGAIGTFNPKNTELLYKNTELLPKSSREVIS